MIIGRIPGALHIWVALLLVLTAAVLHSTEFGFFVVLGIWFLLAIGIGLLLGRWWALLVSPIPWLLGVGVGFATGRYLYLGEYWQVAAGISIGAGLVGIILGLLTRWVILNGRLPVRP